MSSRGVVQSTVVPFSWQVAVIGAGYIAVEMAGILHALGSETHLYFRALARENIRSCCEYVASCISIGFERDEHDLSKLKVGLSDVHPIRRVDIASLQLMLLPGCIVVRDKKWVTTVVRPTKKERASRRTPYTHSFHTAGQVWGCMVSLASCGSML